MFQLCEMVMLGLRDCAWRSRRALLLSSGVRFGEMWVLCARASCLRALSGLGSGVEMFLLSDCRIGIEFG